MESIIDKLEIDRPSFHDDGNGGVTSWYSNTNLLRAAEKHLRPGMRTMEIGAGYSTVMFLYDGCNHTCISPVQAESNRIIEYCKAAGISVESAEFLVGQSYAFLPAMPQESFEFIFIDGAHRFPFPIVDWFFCAMLLKKDGLIVIDDTDIISCHIPFRFMLNDTHWEAVDVRENFGIFRKKGDHNYPSDWQGQSFGRKKDFGAGRARQDLLSRGKSTITQLRPSNEIRQSPVHLCFRRLSDTLGRENTISL